MSMAKTTDETCMNLLPYGNCCRSGSIEQRATMQANGAVQTLAMANNIDLAWALQRV